MQPNADIALGIAVLLTQGGFGIGSGLDGGGPYFLSPWATGITTPPLVSGPHVTLSRPSRYLMGTECGARGLRCECSGLSHAGTDSPLGEVFSAGLSLVGPPRRGRWVDALWGDVDGDSRGSLGAAGGGRPVLVLGDGDICPGGCGGTPGIAGRPLGAAGRAGCGLETTSGGRRAGVRCRDHKEGPWRRVGDGRAGCGLETTGRARGGGLVVWRGGGQEVEGKRSGDERG